MRYYVFLRFLVIRREKFRLIHNYTDYKIILRKQREPKTLYVENNNPGFIGTGSLTVQVDCTDSAV